MVNEYTVKNENKRCKKQSGHCGIGVRAGHVPFKLPVPVTVAALLYKFDLSESAVKVGIVVIYIVSGVIGGFFMGKIMKTQKFLWGFAAGAIYFCILFLISVLVKQGVSMELPKVATTFILCAASGMAGGMIS